MTLVTFDEVLSHLPELPHRPHVAILASCTGLKNVPLGVKPLTATELFGGDQAVLAKRKEELLPYALPAEELYSGRQHESMMAGARALRAIGASVTVCIVSAGYGVVAGGEKLVPYEATFKGLTKPKLRAQADALDVPKRARATLELPADLKIVLLGDDYLEACQLDLGAFQPPCPTVVMCSPKWSRRLPDIEYLCILPLSNDDAQLHKRSLISLKGDLAGRILATIANARKGEPT